MKDNYMTRCGLYDRPLLELKQKAKMTKKPEWKEMRASLAEERMAHAKRRLRRLGFRIIEETDLELKFSFNCETVTFSPFTGWATGKSIKDCRGLQNLINQITPRKK